MNKIFNNIKNKLSYIVIASIGFGFATSCLAPTVINHSGLLHEKNKTAKILASFPPGNFGKIWLNNTIQLYPEFENSSNESGERGHGGGIVPIRASATIMDSTLIKSGLKEYEKLANMNKEESNEYEKSYLEKFFPGGSHFVWLELQTSYTKEVLDLNRWNIYWVVNDTNEYEPTKIVTFEEKDNVSNPEFNFTFGRDDSTRTNTFNNRTINSKTLLLFFPLKDIHGNKTISSKTNYITLVFLDWNNKNNKYIGTWDLSSMRQKNPAE